MKFLLAVAALVAVATSSEENEKLFSKGAREFTVKFFSEVAKANDGKSVVMSAFSVEPLLAQLAFGAEGESQDQILRTIGLPNLNVTREVFPEVSKKLKAVKGVTLNLAAKLFVPEGYELNDNFEKISRETFDAEVQNVDFTKSVDAAKTINTWVEKQTNDKIHNLVSKDDLDDLTRLVMVNAIYFKGNWKTKFNTELTKDRDFHVSSTKTVQIPTMYIEAKFKYAESKKLNAKLLQLPYVGDEAHMLIVLPNEIDGLAALQTKLQDPSVLQEELKNMYEDTVQVSLPKMKIETTTDLKDVLKKLGLKKIFDHANAGLVNLMKTNEKLYISQGIQKAFIEVNEEGSEATAANAFIGFGSSLYAKPKPVFFANQPFYYVLKTNQPLDLFTGVFYGK